ncbi:MAG TPA: beta-ketoacyl synthase N-terminal-like domain-containing protein, partial [Pirellulales bacterium]
MITGLGVASPIGCDLAKFWDLLIRGQSGVAPLDNTVPNAYPVPFAGAVRDFAGSVEDFGELDDKLKKNVKKGLKLMCRETQMGVAVAQKALADAAVQGRVEPERIGVSFGTGYMLTQ